MAWEEIVVSSKIVGHVSAGIYRSAGGALKELVSNAFDADATRVVITTNWPSFDIITCYDNGAGMTLEEFRSLMRGGIGESPKRVDEDITSQLGRPIIGRLGIGMLGVAQICHEFKVISHHRETETAFQATVNLIDYLREKVEEVDPEEVGDEELEVGQFEVTQIDYDPRRAGTSVIAADMRSAFVRKFREAPEPPLPSKFSSFLDTIHRHRSVKELGNYWQMIWELAIACPIPYKGGGPFEQERVKIPDRFSPQFKDLKQELEYYDFEVVVDGLSLRKPNSFPFPLHRKRDRQPMTGEVFPIIEDRKVYGRPLKLFGYVFMQNGQAIQPMEMRGLLIRIRNVAIGVYDATFLNYPGIEGPRFNWLSCELYVEEGLEHALNIDRASFNEMHPHFVALKELVHVRLREVFTKAQQKSTERSRAKRERERTERTKALEELLSQELGDDYEVVETDRGDLPLAIDTAQKRILVNTSNPLWPRAKTKRELAQLAATAFEVSMLVPESERRERFYGLLSQLLYL